MAKDFHGIGADAARRLGKVVPWAESVMRSGTGGAWGDTQAVPYDFRRFELYEACAPNKSALAWRVKWDAGTLGWVTITTEDRFTVWNGPDGSARAVGSRGWAIKRHDGKDWEIIGGGGRAIRLKNASGYSLPAYGACAPSWHKDTDGEYAQYDANLTLVCGSRVVINSSTAVANGAWGIGYMPEEYPAWANYDTSGDTPASGMLCGLKPNATTLRSNLPGFWVLGVDTANYRVLVASALGLPFAFELKESLLQGRALPADTGSPTKGDAWPLKLDGTADEGYTFHVCDYHQKRWSLGRDNAAVGSSGRGARGLCQATPQNTSNGEFQIVKIEEVAICKGTVTANMHAGSSTASVKNILPITPGGQKPTLDATAELTVYNRNIREAKKDSYIVIEPDYSAWEWRVLQSDGLAHQIWATLSADITSSTVAVAIGTGVDGPIHDGFTSATVNVNGWWGLSGDRCLIARSSYDSLTGWEIVFVSPHKIDFIHAIRRHATDDKLEYVILKGMQMQKDEDTWSDGLAFDVPAITTVEVSGNDIIYKWKHCLGGTVEHGPTTIISMTDCEA